MTIIDHLASPEHREHHRRHHDRHAPYGTHAYRWAGMVAELCREYRLITVLDYGAGKRTLAPALQNINPRMDVREYDPCVPEIAAEPRDAELVVCVDTLIFVEQERLAAVLDHIRDLAQRAVLINVPFHPLHKLSEAAGGRWFVGFDDAWWLDQFRARWPLGSSWVAEPKDAEHTRYLWFSWVRG